MERGDIHAYEIPGRPGVRLCVGKPEGRELPHMWISDAQGSTFMLATFNGDVEAKTGVKAIDEMVDAINQVISFYKAKYEPKGGG